MNYLLIWDIDGTLINSMGAGRRAMNYAFHELYGVEDAFENINMAGMLDANILIEAFSLNGILGQEGTSMNYSRSDSMLRAEKDRFFSTYCRFLEKELQEMNASLAAPGIPELLQTLSRDTSFFHALGTGNIERGARIKLAVDHLNGYFPVGGFGDEAAERWQIIKKAVLDSQEYHQKVFSMDNTYVIGDTSRDIACGKKLGCKTIGVATGPFTVQQLSDCHADHVFENFNDTGAFLSIFTKNDDGRKSKG